MNVNTHVYPEFVATSRWMPMPYVDLVKLSWSSYADCPRQLHLVLHQFSGCNCPQLPQRLIYYNGKLPPSLHLFFVAFPSLTSFSISSKPI
ncbi:hypothetical protein Pint_36601 [Pistacia integerrima]|uniref:Uncharacterized protein n=2 Tax=Pistacia TaxID=55512 RepID=A0ACC1AQV6_9ROSI|nr:hypothetical protein Pint_36601 [Pistacia integerrima]KAJ0089038.1 hypothetical protein Patl1_33284 [Pistacia atlantica]